MKRLTHDQLFKAAQEAKITWEKIRVKEVPLEQKQGVIATLLEELQGHILTLCAKHDASRIIQTCLKYGTEEQRDAIYNELREGLKDLCKTKYGHVILKKLFMYCSKPIKAQIIDEQIVGNVLELMKHKDASNIVEHAYTMVASAAQRTALLSELFGSTYSFYAKTSANKDLPSILEKNPDQKDKVVSGIGEVLQRQVEKGVVRHSIIHKLAQVYFQHATEGQKTDMANHLAEAVLEMLHTRAGAMVGLECVTYGAVKDRKRMVKAMKGYVSKVCQEPDGHIVLMAFWDVVDDTVLLREVILKEMAKSLEELLPDRAAQQVILHLLSAANPRYIPGDIVSLLQEIPEGAAKKDPLKRRQELIPHIVPQLLDCCVQHPELLFVPGGADVMVEVIANSQNTSELVAAVATHIAEAQWGEKPEEESRSGYAGLKRVMNAMTAKKKDSGLAAAMVKALKGRIIDFAASGGGFVAALLMKNEAAKSLIAEAQKGEKVLRTAAEATGCSVVLEVLKEAK